MAFPTIPTVAAGRVLWQLSTNPAGTHTSPSLTSLTKDAGDLLIAIVIIYDGNSTNAEFSSWGGGFTEFGDFASTTSMAIGCAYKWSTGSETGTFTVVSADTSANDSAFCLLSISGAHPTTPPGAGSFITGVAAAADPAAFDPSGWDVADVLWVAVAGSGEDSTTGSFTGVAAAPTNYTSYSESGISADAVGGVEGAVAFRQLNASSENVGTFSVDTSNARNAACVIAVPPAPTVLNIAADVPLGLAIDTALTRETFVAAAEALDLQIATNLTVVPGFTEHFIAADFPLGLQVDTALTRETFLAIAETLDLQVGTALTRETFLAVSEAIGLSVGTLLTRETFVAVGEALGFDIATNLQIEGAVRNTSTWSPADGMWI